MPEVVAAVEQVAAALAEPSPASQQAADPPPPPQPDVGFTISDLGYVRSTRPGADPERMVGLVGWKRDGRSIFANCHLHAVCSISAGIMRVNISREWMAAWLVQGEVPPAGATREERRLLGVQHRQLWRKPDVS